MIKIRKFVWSDDGEMLDDTRKTSTRKAMERIYTNADDILFGAAQGSSSERPTNSAQSRRQGAAPTRGSSWRAVGGSFQCKPDARRYLKAHSLEDTLKGHFEERPVIIMPRGHPPRSSAAVWEAESLSHQKRRVLQQISDGPDHYIIRCLPKAEMPWQEYRVTLLAFTL